MKKMIAILIALMMALSLTAALAENYDDVEDNPEMTAMFYSDWVSGTSPDWRRSQCSGMERR